MKSYNCITCKNKTVAAYGGYVCVKGHYELNKEGGKNCVDYENVIPEFTTPKYICFNCTKLEKTMDIYHCRFVTYKDLSCPEYEEKHEPSSVLEKRKESDNLLIKESIRDSFIKHQRSYDPKIIDLITQVILDLKEKGLI